MHAQRLGIIRKQFRKHPEWLLIKVTKMSKRTNTTLAGLLLNHSPLRDEMYKELMAYRAKYKRKDILSVEYSDPRLPKDVALIFYAKV